MDQEAPLLPNQWQTSNGLSCQKIHFWYGRVPEAQCVGLAKKPCLGKKVIQSCRTLSSSKTTESARRDACYFQHVAKPCGAYSEKWARDIGNWFNCRIGGVTSQRGMKISTFKPSMPPARPWWHNSEWGIPKMEFLWMVSRLGIIGFDVYSRLVYVTDGVSSYLPAAYHSAINCKYPISTKRLH